MAEPLKQGFGPDVPALIADLFARVRPAFPGDLFVADALAGYDRLELTPRARDRAGAPCPFAP